jgi:hypothetical protein
MDTETINYSPSDVIKIRKELFVNKIFREKFQKIMNSIPIRSFYDELNKTFELEDEYVIPKLLREEKFNFWGYISFFPLIEHEATQETNMLSIIINDRFPLVLESDIEIHKLITVNNIIE